jgi:phosphate-selective porin OprO/OprP
MKTAASLGRLITIFFACDLFAAGAYEIPADDRDDRIRALEKRVEQLEKLLLKQEGTSPSPTPPPEAVAGAGPVAVAPAKPGPILSVGASGFALRSADTNFVLRLRGLLQLDSHWSDDDNATDAFLVRRARPILAGTVFRDFDFRFTPEFGGASPTIRDAWINYRYNSEWQLRVGKMKTPGGLERWQSVSDITFIERSLVAALWPVRDLGVMLHGELWPQDEALTSKLGWNGLVNYAAGVFNGSGDSRAAGNNDFDGDKTVAGRLFVHPFLRSDLTPLRQFGLGLSGTYGEMNGIGNLPDDFSYTNSVFNDGLNWRLGPQAYWYWGPFGLLGEYAASSQRLQHGTAPVDSVVALNRAWAITASWLLTGEDGTFRAVTPRKHFDPRAGGWGAWQIAASYSRLDIDDDVFPNFADPTELPERTATWGLGLNWYLNSNVRASFNYLHTDFTGGRSGSIADLGEDVFYTRLQLSF